MQETLAEPPLFDPPVAKWYNIYKERAHASYGLLITGQVQVDVRFLSIAGCRPPRHGAPGAPLQLGDTWLDKIALDKILGRPKAITLTEIDQVVADFVRGAQVAKAAGFLLSQFLSPWTNRREDDYGAAPEKRVAFLKRLVGEIREVCPSPFCLSVKLNSGDYMAEGGLSTDEAPEQVRWLLECGMVDFVEISGGNAEQSTSKRHNSFDKTISKAPVLCETTQIREAFFTDLAERVQKLNSKVPVQLSGGFRSRTGMADAVRSGVCDLVGPGRAAVLEPSIPRDILLNSDLPDEMAVALPHIVRGQWLARWTPVKVVGSRLAIQFFHWNMRRLGMG